MILTDFDTSQLVYMIFSGLPVKGAALEKNS